MRILKIIRGHFAKYVNKTKARKETDLKKKLKS